MASNQLPPQIVPSSTPVPPARIPRQTASSNLMGSIFDISVAPTDYSGFVRSNYPRRGRPMFVVGDHDPTQHRDNHPRTETAGNVNSAGGNAASPQVDATQASTSAGIAQSASGNGDTLSGQIQKPHQIKRKEHHALDSCSLRAKQLDVAAKELSVEGETGGPEQMGEARRGREGLMGWMRRIVRAARALFKW